MKHHPTVSVHLLGFAADDNGVLEIVYRDGTLKRFTGVPAKVSAALYESDRQTDFIARELEGRYPVTVGRCEN